MVITPYTVTYDGSSHTAAITSIKGVNGETGATVGTVTLNTTHTNAGTYASDSWSFTGAANYNNIAATTITDTINKAALTVTAKPETKTYGQTFTFAGTEFTTSGLVVSSDTVTSATLSSSGSAPAAPVAGSPYTIFIGAALGTGLSNYNITYVIGSMTVNRATPAIATTPNVTNVNLGVGTTPVLTDTAALSNGYYETGTITFSLYNPSNVVVYTDTVTVNGNGNYDVTTGNNPGGYTLPVTGVVTGTYQWDAAYNPGTDPNHNSSSEVNSACERVTVSGTSIGGIKYFDVTGNGLTADDTPMAGATFSVYADADHDNDNTLDAADGPAVATATSAANGTFSLSLGSLPSGTYFLKENPLSGFVQTGPALPLYYTINVVAGSQNGGYIYKFADAEICDQTEIDKTSLYYTVSGPGICGTETVSDLRGNTFEGDTVTVHFTPTSTGAGEQVSLVSYTAPGSSFDANTASQQMIFMANTDAITAAQVGKPQTLTVVLPNCDYQVDFVCGAPIDHFGPAGSNIFYSAQGRLFSADNGGTQLYATSSLSGYVYVDVNNNGVKDSGEAGIANVTLNLSGTDVYGHAVTATTTTNSAGYFAFNSLAASIVGGYTITEVPPAGYLNGKDTAGSLGGTVGTDLIKSIVVNTNSTGVNYDFGELPTPVVTGDTATIGFWHNQNGQALIDSLNGCSTSTQLASWLATTFPNLYGAGAGSHSMLHSNGTPLTNSEVAALYLTSSFFGALGQKTYAQVLSVALATYVTSTNLAGGNAAAAYGFNTSAGGVGSHTYNVGSNGAAFGVANNSTLTISQMLCYTNSQSCYGVLYNGNSNLINMANTVYGGINTTGDIV